MRVKRREQRTNGTRSMTPSKGEGGEKEKGREGEERRGGAVKNTLTVTTSSIKQSHYTLISTCTRTHSAVDPVHFRGH